MRCKKHLSDCSSAVGVCASCLRERLLTIIETQSKYQAQVLLVKPQLEDEHRKSDVIQQHITFPKSVSPYISRRKSDATAVWLQLPHSLSEQRFYSTPQVGANGIFMSARSSLRESRTRKIQFSSFSNLFRSKTSTFESESDLNFDANTKHKKSKSINTRLTEAQQTKSQSSWFTNLFRSKKKKKSDSNIGSMSFPDEREYSCETCPKNTPMQATPQRRKQDRGRKVAGLSFCLSPLVRPTPNRSRNQKGGLPEMVIQSGEMKVSPGRPTLGAAASYRANRSRKLANFGRFHPNY